jgi:hypothetical protein
VVGVLAGQQHERVLLCVSLLADGAPEEDSTSSSTALSSCVWCHPPAGSQWCDMLAAGCITIWFEYRMRKAGKHA